jgi:hypothetical protein
MKKLIIFIYLVFFISKVAKAQPPLPHCSETIITSTPTINVWDWRTEIWDTKMTSNAGGGIVFSVTSPFYGLDNLTNKNVSRLTSSLAKDYQTEDGWELLQKNLGEPNKPAVSQPYVLFYNKFTSKIRAFFPVVQLYSELSQTEKDQGAIVKISFLNDETNYQSNLLSSYSAPLMPLDKFRRDLNIITPNVFANTTPYWLYADFPVAYDPCTCSNNNFTKITIETRLFDKASVDITINSLEYQSPIRQDKVDGSTDFLQSFSAFAGNVEGGLKAVTSAGDGLEKINDVIAKQTKVNIKSKLTGQFGQLSNDVNSFGNWLSIIPFAGTVVNSLTSLFDSFSGGGSSTKGPTPVMIMNDFKASGKIERNIPKNSATIYLPGSDQSNRDQSLKPVYNNILGVFNFLYTPEVLFNYSTNSQTSTIEDVCYENSSQRFISHSVTTTSTPTQLLLSNDPRNLKFAINPALNIDLSKSDIRCAYIVEGCDYQYYSSTNLNIDIEKGGKPVYRSSYHPIGNFRNNEAVPIFSLNSITTVDNPNCPFIMDNIVSTSNCTPNIFIKVVARLRRQNSTNSNEDIIFIGKYQVNASGTFDNFRAAGIQDLIEDIQLPTSQPISAAQNQWSAQNSILSSSFSNPTNTPIFLSAGSSVTATAGSSFVSGSKLSISNLYPNSAALTASLKATSSDLNTFCGGSVYRNPARYQNARMATEIQEESFQIDEAFSVFPNPATDQVTFRYFVQDRTPVRISIVNLNGQVVSVPLDTESEYGIHEVKFDVSNLPAGIYIYTLETNKGKETKRLVVIK